jgi:hypothetical protein
MRVPCRESGIFSVIKELTRLLLNPKAHCYDHDSLPHVASLSHKNPIHVLLSYSLNVDFNIVHFVHSCREAKQASYQIDTTFNSPVVRAAETRN